MPAKHDVLRCFFCYFSQRKNVNNLLSTARIDVIRVICSPNAKSSTKENYYHRIAAITIYSHCAAKTYIN